MGQSPFGARSWAHIFMPSLQLHAPIHIYIKASAARMRPLVTAANGQD